MNYFEMGEESNLPFYDLKCSKCLKEFNIKASIKEKEEKQIKCPFCGSQELETIFSGINIITSKKNEHPACPNAGSCGGCCGI